MNYEVGDTVVYSPFGSTKVKVGVITAKHAVVGSSCQPGFVMTTDVGSGFWGLDEHILEVRSAKV
jgi:hypothetical protein